MNTKPERLDKDGFPIPGGFDSAPIPRPSPPPSAQRNEFALNVRNIRPLSGDRKYRLYFRNGELFFIRTGGQDNINPVAIQFGLLGVLIAALFRRGEKSPEQIAGLDQAHPKDL